MALNKFQVKDQATGIGGWYCKITSITAKYDSNVSKKKPEARGWKDVSFRIEVWRDADAREADLKPIDGLGWDSTIPARLLEGFTILDDNEATLELVYPLLRLNDPRLMDATDC